MSLDLPACFSSRQADLYLQCINEHLLCVDSLFSLIPGGLKIVILVFNAFISVLVVASSEWSPGKEAILVGKAGWYTEHTHSIRVSPSSNIVRTAVSSARFPRFVDSSCAVAESAIGLRVRRERVKSRFLSPAGFMDLVRSCTRSSHLVLSVK